MDSKSKDSLSLSEVLIPAAKGFAVSIISAAILLFAFTAIANGMEDPDSVTAAFGYLALYLTAAASGIGAARFSRRMGGTSALIGGVSGIMLLLAVILVSLIPAKTAESVSPAIRALMYAAIPAVSALMGFAAKKRKSHKSKYRRRR